MSWCATCDGFFFRDQDIAVIGGGDSAMEEATFLTRFARSVTVVHRRDALRASKIMQDRAFANPKIKFRWDSEVAEVLGEGKVTGLRLRNTKTGEERHAGGQRACSWRSATTRAASCSPASWPTDSEGYLLVEQPTTRTGDRRRVRLRRRGGPHLPPGGHRGRHRLCGRARRRAVAGGPGETAAS